MAQTIARQVPHSPTALYLFSAVINSRTSLVTQTVGICLQCRRQVRSLGQEDPLEKEMATHCSMLVWEIPCTAEPGMGSQGSDTTCRLNHQPSKRSWQGARRVGLTGRCWASRAAHRTCTCMGPQKVHGGPRRQPRSPGSTHLSKPALCTRRRVSKPAAEGRWPRGRGPHQRPMADACQIHFPIKLKRLRKHTLESVTGEPHPATREERHPQSLREQESQGQEKGAGVSPRIYPWLATYLFLSQQARLRGQDTEHQWPSHAGNNGAPRLGGELTAAGRRGRLGSLGWTRTRCCTEDGSPTGTHCKHRELCSMWQPGWEGSLGRMDTCLCVAVL